MSQDAARATSGLAPGAKDIMVFCDGTGKDGRTDKGFPTNIWNLYYFLSQSSEEDFKGLAQKPEMLYIPGVGSGESHISNLPAQMFGEAAVEMVVDAYNYIAKHYKAGDRIWLFGYSRGAYVARKLASLIYRIGLVASEKDLRTRWKQHEKPREDSKPESFDNSVPIKCLAVWGTVGHVHSRWTLQLRQDVLGIPDTELPLNVENAFHAVAMHNSGELYKSILFEPNHRTNLKQIWFPGSHTEVGGGLEVTDLADASLFWIMDEMKGMAGMPCFKDGVLRTHRLELFKPHDAHAESSDLIQLRNKRQTRIESGVLNSSCKIHESMFYPLHEI